MAMRFFSDFFVHYYPAVLTLVAAVFSLALSRSLSEI